MCQRCKQSQSKSFWKLKQKRRTLANFARFLSVVEYIAGDKIRTYCSIKFHSDAVRDYILCDLMMNRRKQHRGKTERIRKEWNQVNQKLSVLLKENAIFENKHLYELPGQSSGGLIRLLACFIINHLFVSLYILYTVQQADKNINNWETIRERTKCNIFEHRVKRIKIILFFIIELNLLVGMYFIYCATINPGANLWWFELGK